MAVRRNLSAQAVSFGGDATVEQYLRSLGSRLHGPARARSTILEEIRGELGDALDAHTSHGESPLTASRLAVAELGSPEVVAAAFAGELATAQARGVLWSLLLTGPLVGVWWFLLLVPTPSEPKLGLVLTAIPILPLVAPAVGAALIAIATTGSLIRWLPETLPHRALTAAIAVALVCMVCDVSVLLILPLHVVEGSADSYPVALAVMAAIASGIRIVGSGWAIRHCLRSRKALEATV